MMDGAEDFDSFPSRHESDSDPSQPTTAGMDSSGSPIITDHEQTRHPYVVGNIVKLQLKTPFDGQTTYARIIKVFEPFTWSSAMVVRPLYPTPAWEDDMVLKLFDRRFATGLRESEKSGPWTLDIEQNYHQFVLDGDAAKLMTELETNRDLATESSIWNSSHEETSLHDAMSCLCEREIDAYNTLIDLQGNGIPKFFSRVIMSISNLAQNTLPGEFLNIPGILLQYIDGVSLADVATHTPRDSWQSICDDAIRIINMVGDRGIINEDVNPRNFVVQNHLENHYHVFMIDFAACEFREEYAEWEKYKALRDEEGAIGYVMQRKLQGGFVYHRSARSKELDDKYNREDC